jgi:capsular exopolysaccharide synthesis family protein
MRDPNSPDGRPWRYSLVEHDGGRHDHAPTHYSQEYDPRYDPRYQGSGYGGGYGAQPPAQERSLGEIFRNLWRRKFTILGGMFACALIAYIVALTIAPRYTAGGMLAVETRPLFIPQIGVQPQPWAPDVSIPRTEVQVLRSRDLVETVARKLNLDREPDLNPYAVEPSIFGSMTAALRNVLASIGIGHPSPGPTEDAVWSAVVDSVLENLTIGTDGRSYAIYVSFESENPAISAAVSNGLMQAFIAKQIDNSNSTLMEANGWIKQRSVELLKDVEEANKKVQAYRIANNMVETRAGSVSAQQVNEINTQLSTARADLSQADARLRQAQGESGRGASGSTAAEVLNSPLVQSLRVREAEASQRQAEMATRLAPAHPQRKAVAQELSSIRGQIDREIGKLVSSLKSQADIARSRVDSLTRQLSGLEGRATSMASNEIELRQLEQEAETKRNVYQSFLATAQQTAEQPRINQANARIVSAAPTPVLPTSPNKKLMVMGSMLIGFFMTSAAVLLLGERRRGFESTEDIESILGLPVLGALPLLRHRRKAGRGLSQSFVGQPHESVIAETLRGIRIAIGCRRGSAVARAKVVLVTSSEPGEGKTTFTSSLGAVAAQDGLRVLIVDSDLRRPQFHRMLRAEPGPALSEVLNGTESLASVVRTDPESGAHCLTMQNVEHPVELLSSAHWATFLQQARSSYDLIILDSPPVMHVADALTLADHVDTAIFVIAHGSTRRRTVEEALKRFATSGRQVAGVVLSKVPSLQTTHSYYSGYASA